MVRRDAYEDEGPAGPGGAFNVLRLIGQSRHLSSGFVGFAIKAFTVSACSAAMFGITSYFILGKALGPVLPFLGGAAFGFTGGIVHRYRTDVEEAQLMLERYPKVMQHHIAQVEPAELRDTSLARWRQDLCTNLRKQGLLITALYSASNTINKLQEEEEERILELYREGARGGPEAADAY